MNCHVRTIERCYTYLLENTTYEKSITITTQSGLQTLVNTMTITSPPPRVIPYIAIISVIDITLHIPRMGMLNYQGMWFSWTLLLAFTTLLSICLLP